MFLNCNRAVQDLKELFDVKGTLNYVGSHIEDFGGSKTGFKYAGEEAWKNICELGAIDRTKALLKSSVTTLHGEHAGEYSPAKIGAFVAPKVAIAGLAYAGLSGDGDN